MIIGVDLNGPPVCTAAAPSIASLWPANHQMVDIHILGLTDPDNDALTVTITAITQDEPVNGTGDGDTGPDAAGLGTSTAQLRAERAGNGNGRVYHISFSAADPLGYTCTGAVNVSVPKNQGKYGAAIDDGPLYDSTAPGIVTAADQPIREQAQHIYIPLINR